VLFLKKNLLDIENKNFQKDFSEIFANKKFKTTIKDYRISPYILSWNIYLLLKKKECLTNLV
jgi:hypothetical protein